MTHQDNNITEEIIDMAPILAAIPKSKLHRVPENYFDDVESIIISQLNLIKNEKAQDHQVPSDYFETIEDNILTRIHEETQESKIVPIPTSRFVYMKYAAILVVLIASLIVFNFLKPQENAQLASDLTQAETLDYMVDHAEDFDINMLIDQDIIDESTLDGLSYLTIEEENEDIFESDF
jgi:hypothetical protein